MYIKKAKTMTKIVIELEISVTNKLVMLAAAFRISKER